MDFAPDPPDPAAPTEPAAARPHPARGVARADEAPADDPRLERLVADAMVSPEVWVFGYGSLIWKPGFDPVAAHRAHLHGWHRAFCVESVRYRGTPERPGLVLGLDRGGSCRGRVFRVPDAEREAVLRYLYRREMIRYTYQPRWVRVRLDEECLSGDGAGTATVTALTFVADRVHPGYCRPAPDAAVARILSSAGESGSNFDYLVNTVEALRAMNCRCGHLERLLVRVLAARGS